MPPQCRQQSVGFMNYVKLKLKSEPDNFHRAIPGENFDRVSSNQEIEV